MLAKSPNVSINGSAATKLSLNASTNGPPNSIATSVTWFRNILSFDSVVSYRLLASSVNALFSLKAVLDISTASENNSLALPARNKESRKRTSDIPSSSNNSIAVVPFSSAEPKPSINAPRAPTASSSNAFLNCSPVIPAIAANPSKSFPAAITFFISVVVMPKSIANDLNDSPSWLASNSNSRLVNPVALSKSFIASSPV